VTFAEHSQVLDRCLSAQRDRHHVVELDAPGRAADPARVELLLTPIAIAQPDRPLHRGRDGARIRGALVEARWNSRWPGVPHQRLLAILPLQEEVERRLQHLLGRGARERVG